MPADNDLDPVDRWLGQQVWPMSPPDGAFEKITKRARRRRIQKTVVSVASAAAVVVAIAVAVPLGLSSGFGKSPTSNVADGSSATPSGSLSQPALGTATPRATASPATHTPSASASTSWTSNLTVTGSLPDKFIPSSVTWVSATTGWILGQAGTPGKCGAQGNSDVCTSVAVTHDGGQTWSGLPAPTTGAPQGTTGVGQVRFLNGEDGWAFGPELWSTTDGGESWKPVNTGGKVVTDLETMNGRAYAIWGTCTAPSAGNKGDAMANCTSYTLKASVAGTGTWTAVSGVPVNLTSGSTAKAAALLELAGHTQKAPATGYFVGPDGNLYAGPLDGSAWSLVQTLPCAAALTPTSDGTDNLLLAPAGVVTGGQTRLAIVCAKPTIADTVVYLSDDGGATWKKQSVGTAGTAKVGEPMSLTASSEGTLILATSSGIYLLPAGATSWQAATLADSSGTTYGFTYVGMTDSTQGVAIGGSPALYAIWMTADGGQTWQLKPIQK